MPSALKAAIEPAAREIVSLNVPSAPQPYQGLLYANPDYPVIPKRRLKLMPLETAKTPVLHLHWDDRLFGRDKSLDVNERDMEEKLTALQQYKAEGGKILWTIHNRLPHNIRDMQCFGRARQALVPLADAIHVHADHARDFMVQAYGANPDKIHVIPHPSYLGAYEPAEITLSRPLAESDKRQFLFFGMFREQKGIDAIGPAAAKLIKRNIPYTLRMYGKAFKGQRRLIDKLAENPNIDLRTDRIPDEEIPDIFGAAHVFVIPFTQLFSSGTVMLAQTFGLPVIGPAIPELKEITAPQNHNFLYDPESPRGLLRLMTRAGNMPNDVLAKHRATAFEYSKTLSPEHISAQIKQLILTL